MPECRFVSACSSFSLPFLFLMLDSYFLVPFLLAVISLRNSWAVTCLSLLFPLVSGHREAAPSLHALFGNQAGTKSVPIPVL